MFWGVFMNTLQGSGSRGRTWLFLSPPASALRIPTTTNSKSGRHDFGMPVPVFDANCIIHLDLVIHADPDDYTPQPVGKRAASGN